MTRNKHTRPSPAIAIAVLALVAALAGTALAGSDPDATTSVSKKNTTRIAKTQARAISKKQIKKRESGLDVNSATTADSATNVSGRTPFLIKLAAGQTQTIATNGAVSVEANCRLNGNDAARILAQTTQDGAATAGADTFNAGNFNTGTAAADRELLVRNAAPGVTQVENDIDDGFVMAPDGKWLGIDGESTALGLNYAGAKCVLAGVVNAAG